MRKSFVLILVLALGIAMVSCSGNATDNHEKANASQPSATESARSANSKPTNEMIFNKLVKGLEKRGVTLSEAQESELKSLIETSGITKENFKEKRREITDQIMTDILTKDQKQEAAN